jgi:hypothetical protein
MTITYLRLLKTKASPTGTYGVFLHDHIPFAVGLEPIHPIIPVGKYSVSWFLSPKRKIFVYQLFNVPGHDGVQIHIGNQTQDTDGCLLIGSSYGPTQVKGITQEGIIASSQAFTVLKNRVGTQKPWTLIVKEV